MYNFYNKGHDCRTSTATEMLVVNADIFSCSALRKCPRNPRNIAQEKHMELCLTGLADIDEQ